MSSIAKIKVCGITRKEDAKAAVNLGVDFIGLNLYPLSPRVIAPDCISDLFMEIPRGKRVYINVLPSPAKLKKMLDIGKSILGENKKIYFHKGNAENLFFKDLLILVFFSCDNLAN